MTTDRPHAAQCRMCAAMIPTHVEQGVHVIDRHDHRGGLCPGAYCRAWSVPHPERSAHA